jgi:hypothetical protein
MTTTPSNQSDLFSTPPATDPTDADLLRRHLAFYNGFLTRDQLCTGLGWSERRLRDACEALGTDIVRCQAGFMLTERVTRDQLPAAIQGSDAMISQAKKNMRYGFGLRRKLHARLG